MDIRGGMDSFSLARTCRSHLENKKAENLVTIDVRGISSITDFFIIASGTGLPHLRALREELTTGLSRGQGLHAAAVDGNHEGGWVVLDYFDVIVHLMTPEVRDRFKLESLWGDAPRVAEGEAKPAGKEAPAE